MSTQKRGNVWLGVSGLVINQRGEWLVVKKRYGGLKGMWSLPAGFVDGNETADQAVIREIKEETGIDAMNKGLIGLRTGVIKEEISDNMLVFLLEPVEPATVLAAEDELYEAKFILPSELLESAQCSILLQILVKMNLTNVKPEIDGMNPGDQFGYSAYKLFF
jgi:ADP-ribose pyrophosphatase YjhB (NUDIX family)